MAETEVVSWIDNIEAAENLDDLKKFYRAAYQEAEKLRDNDAIKAFVKAKDKRKVELDARS